MTNDLPRQWPHHFLIISLHLIHKKFCVFLSESQQKYWDFEPLPCDWCICTSIAILGLCEASRVLSILGSRAWTAINIFWYGLRIYYVDLTFLIQIKRGTWGYIFFCFWYHSPHILGEIVLVTTYGLEWWTWVYEDFPIFSMTIIHQHLVGVTTLKLIKWYLILSSMVFYNTMHSSLNQSHSGSNLKAFHKWHTAKLFSTL